MEINHQPVNNAAEAVKLGRAAKGDQILLKVWHRDSSSGRHPFPQRGQREEREKIARNLHRAGSFDFNSKTRNPDPESRLGFSKPENNTTGTTVFTSALDIRICYGIRISKRPAAEILTNPPAWAHPFKSCLVIQAATMPVQYKDYYQNPRRPARGERRGD